MRIAVLGAGAMGSWIGGHLALSGNDVCLLTTNNEHINAVRENGLILKHGQRVDTVQLPIGKPDEFNDEVHLIIVLTKTFQLKTALSSISNTLTSKTAVLSLQNGLGNSEVISEFVSAENIWIGMTMLPVDREAPGIVVGKGVGGTWFGNAQGGINPLGKTLEAAFTKSGIQVKYDPEIVKRIWQKVAFNAGMNAVCALTHSTPGTINRSPFALKLVKAVAKEVAQVAKAESVEVDLASVFNTIEYACEHHGAHIPSMLRDLLQGRQTEVDALNGAIASRAEATGTQAPLNHQLAGLIKLAEMGHREV
ncbi:MAG: 2-dehydropantoate 2-reductase [Granulosicoccaceae bacterium]